MASVACVRRGKKESHRGHVTRGKKTEFVGRSRPNGSANSHGSFQGSAWSPCLEQRSSKNSREYRIQLGWETRGVKLVLRLGKARTLSCNASACGKGLSCQFRAASRPSFCRRLAVRSSSEWSAFRSRLTAQLGRRLRC